jgi:hypothetical protein
VKDALRSIDSSMTAQSRSSLITLPPLMAQTKPALLGTRVAIPVAAEQGEAVPT